MKTYFCDVLRRFCFGLAIALILSVILLGQKTSISKVVKIDGVYEFVSRETTLSNSGEGKETLSAPEWGGAWFLSKGAFSIILMRKKRTLYDEREKYDEDYESMGGIYTVKGRSVTLKPLFALWPFEQGRPIWLEYKIKGDLLILTQTLYPYLEDPREGTIVTTLKRGNPQPERPKLISGPFNYSRPK